MFNFYVAKLRAKSLDMSIVYNSIYNIMSKFYVLKSRAKSLDIYVCNLQLVSYMFNLLW
jgi:hypothetical protein